MTKRVLRKSTFIGGALAITAAGVLHSLMGALFRPVMVRLFAPFDGWDGTFGVGLFQIPLAYYQVALSFTAFGINTAVARMIAVREGQDDAAGLRAVIKSSVILTMLVGLIMASLLFLGADHLAGISANSQAIQGFRAVAGAVFIVTVSAAFRGLFQGLHLMAAVAWSQAIEVVVRFVMSILAVVIWAPRDVAFAAAMANGAAVIGAATALGYLMWAARGVMPTSPDSLSFSCGSRGVYAELISTAIPVSLIGALQPISYLIDTAVAIRQLLASGYSATDATALYGQLFQAYSVVNLPPVLGQALYLSLVPAVTRAVITGDIASARDRLNSSLRYVLLLGIPATAGVFFLANPIYRLMFGSELGVELLRTLAIVIIFLMVQSVSTALLQGLGDFRTPLVSLGIGLGVKLVLAFSLTRWLGITGTAWSTIIAFMSVALYSLVASGRRVALSSRLWGYLLRGSASAVVMVVYLEGVGRAPWWPPLVLGLQVAGGAAMYFAVLLMLGGVTWSDMTQLPLPRALKERVALLAGTVNEP